MKRACFVRIALLGATAISLIGASTAPENVLASDGGLYDVGGFRLYLTCSGVGSPAVILDAGLGADHTEWSAVQAAVAKFTRVLQLGSSWAGKERAPSHA